MNDFLSKYIHPIVQLVYILLLTEEDVFTQVRGFQIIINM